MSEIDNEFDASIRERLARTKAELAEARRSDDEYLVNMHLGELDSLARIAVDHGIEVDGVHEALTGSLPVIDLDAVRRQQSDAGS
jgi:hypothetical protein